jgi:hypothetical protein
MSRLPVAGLSRIQPREARCGTLGYVRFTRDGCEIEVMCEIRDIDRSGSKLEIIVVGSDRTCLWIPIEDFYIKT